MWLSFFKRDFPQFTRKISNYLALGVLTSFILGMYSYTKRIVADAFDQRPRKTMAQSTVTHFNLVHFDCHHAAVMLVHLWTWSSFSNFFSAYIILYSLLAVTLLPCRSARNRDEWESAMLHNANTKCNGLLPLWGSQVTEASFASCLAK